MIIEAQGVKASSESFQFGFPGNMKITQLIQDLKRIQQEHGDVDVLMPGWNDSGHVLTAGVCAQGCFDTANGVDGEVIRARVIESEIAATSSSNRPALAGPRYTVAVLRYS